MISDTQFSYQVAEQKMANLQIYSSLCKPVSLWYKLVNFKFKPSQQLRILLVPIPKRYPYAAIPLPENCTWKSEITLSWKKHENPQVLMWNTGKNTKFGVKRYGFNVWLWDSPIESLWEGQLTSLNLQFLTCKIGKINISQGFSKIQMKRWMWTCFINRKVLCVPQMTQQLVAQLVFLPARFRLFSTQQLEGLL